MRCMTGKVYNARIQHVFLFLKVLHNCLLRSLHSRKTIIYGKRNLMMHKPANIAK